MKKLLLLLIPAILYAGELPYQEKGPVLKQNNDQFNSFISDSNNAAGLNDNFNYLVNNKLDITAGVNNYSNQTIAGQKNFTGFIGINTTTPMSDAVWASNGIDIVGTRPTICLRNTAYQGISTIRFQSVSTDSQMHLNYSDEAVTSTSCAKLSLYSYQASANIIKVYST
jgi:hypothetical protein